MNKKNSIPYEAQCEGLQEVTRRYFIKQCSMGLAGLAMAGFGDKAYAAGDITRDLRFL